MEVFSAKLGTGVLWSTVFMCALPIVLFLILKIAHTLRHKKFKKRSKIRFEIIFPIFFSIVWLGGLIFAYRGAPVSYEIGKDKVIINTRKEQIAVPFSEIKDVWIDKKGKYRITGATVKGHGWAVRGIFGNYGVFSTYKHGWVRIYATDMSKIVVLETDMPTIITPDDPEKFGRILLERLNTKKEE